MSRRPRSPLRAIRTVLVMIKFSHTVFAMPFGLAALVLASPGGIPPLRVVCWVVVAMVSARSAAMAFNRLADQHLDALNPRTSGRALPAGTLTRRTVWIFVALSSFLFFLAAGMLNRLSLALSPAVMAILLGYSLFKRFSVAVHLVLGLCLGLAPCGAWVAVRGAIDQDLLVPLLLGAAVLTWVAGFDIIYSCQDIDHDRRLRLHSLPTMLGVGPSLWVSAMLHVATVALLVGLARAAALGPIYLSSVGLLAFVLVVEHWLVRPRDLSRIGAAFFNVNGWVGVVFFLGVLADVRLGG